MSTSQRQAFSGKDAEDGNRVDVSLDEISRILNET
jgi:hypothetical protein